MEEELSIIKDAHKKYVEWWMPIDLACNSCMDAMSVHRFCETIVTYNDDWFERWIDIPKNKKIAFKKTVLKFIIAHYTHVFDLNKKEN
jgi:hypothetical protein